MIFKILLLLILTLINGVFSATEIAFLSINKYELGKKVKEGNKKAIKIRDLLSDSSSFLSAIQIVITLSGFLASAFAAESFAGEIAKSLNIALINIETLTSILVVLITLILSYFTLVLGELVPKKIGLAYSNKIAFSMVNIISFVLIAFKPFIFILKCSTDFFTRILHIKEKSENAEDDIKSSIEDSSLEELEKKILLNVFEFNDTCIKDVMTPKEDVITISIDSKIEEIVKIIKKYKYTRFPVIDNGEIVGIINIKDLIIKKNKNFNIKKYIRKVISLKSNMIIDDAFLYLNSHYEAMAIVKDKTGYIGIVTIEDILEDLIGNIYDEYDE